MCALCNAQVYNVLMYIIVYCTVYSIITVQKYLARAAIHIARRIMTWPTENCTYQVCHPSAFGNRNYLPFRRSRPNYKYGQTVYFAIACQRL